MDCILNFLILYFINNVVHQGYEMFLIVTFTVSFSIIFLNLNMSECCIFNKILTAEEWVTVSEKGLNKNY